MGVGESPSPEAGRELKNMVTAHLTVDISTRCEAEGEGKGGTGLRLSACPALGLLESLQPMTDLASGSSPDLKADVDTQALRTRLLPCSWLFYPPSPPVFPITSLKKKKSALPGSVSLMVDTYLTYMWP